MTTPNRSQHIRLTSHPEPGAVAPRSPIRWGAATAAERGPLIGTTTRPSDRNVIGAHGGAYGALPRIGRVLRRAEPAREARPHQHEPGRHDRPASAMGATPARSSRSIRSAMWCRMSSPSEIAEGLDIRPTIAVTKARLNLPEILTALSAKRLKPDGEDLEEIGEIAVTKVAIDPVWYLPGVAERFGVAEIAASPHLVRADRRHVPRARDTAGPFRFPAADRRSRRSTSSARSRP